MKHSSTFILLLMLCFAWQLHAQKQDDKKPSKSVEKGEKGVNPLSKGQLQLNAGLGISNWGVPVYVGIDYGIHKDISIGAEVSGRSYREKWNNGRYNHTVIGILANGNYHFNKLFKMSSKWNVYAGLSLGYYIWNSPNDYNGESGSGIGLGSQVGARYFFTDKFGINLEFFGSPGFKKGHSHNNGKFGITYQF